MKTINLVFGTNNSVAVGTPDHRIEDTYNKAFKPFLTTLYKYPEIHITAYYSGILMEWFEERHPEFIMLINEMVKRGQVELLGGTYYETVLPLIPSNDRSAQIELLTTFVRRRFGKRPRGAWITELVWEPGMPFSLSKSGIEYIFLADSHFVGAGLRGPELLEPVITEDQGKTLLIFPTASENGLFPFKQSPWEAVNNIKASADESGRRMISLISDGECYGFWNGSGTTLYDDQWLAQFLDELRAAKDTVVTTHPLKYSRLEGEVQKRYFASTSYEDMTRWSLPIDRGREFDKIKGGRLSKNSRAYFHGGYFRQFLSKYRESNLMYSKTMHVNVLVNQVRGDKYQKRSAREELWKGENHSAYWHGKRGGIYLSPTRKAVYSALISAEKSSRQRGVFKSHVSIEDFDMDGLAEYLYHGNEINMYVHRNGGMVFELDYLANPWNYLDTLTRIPELYHDRDDVKYIIDSYPRKAFLDHFLNPKEHIDGFSKANFSELGDFLDKAYTVKECRKDAMDLTFTADGNVGRNGSGVSVHLEKRYRMKRNTISIEYSITNSDTNSLETCFAPEINLSFSAMEDAALQLSVQRKGKPTGIAPQIAELSDVDGFSSLDLTNGVTITGSWTEPAELWIVPVEARWTDWAGTHVGYQSTCFLPRFPLSLKAGDTWSAAVSLTLARTK